MKQIISDNGFDFISVFDGEGQDYITACIGMDMISGRVVYDYELMIEYLMKIYMTQGDDNESEAYSSAIEWIDYNTLRALPYFQNSPIILDRDIPV